MKAILPPPSRKPSPEAAELAAKLVEITAEPADWDGATPPAIDACRHCGREVGRVEPPSVTPPLAVEIGLRRYRRACVRDARRTWTWCGQTEKGRVDIG